MGTDWLLGVSISCYHPLLDEGGRAAKRLVQAVTTGLLGSCADLNGTVR